VTRATVAAMKRLVLVALVALPIAARATAPSVAKPTLADGPATKLAITTTPAPETEIDADTKLRVVGEYSVPDFKAGKDRITIVFKTAGGKTWEPAKYLLTKAQGRVTFDLQGADLLKESSLVRPFQVVLVLDRGEGADARTLKASETVPFPAKRTADSPRPAVNILPPQIGAAQLVSDMKNDARYQPKLPAVLDVPGQSYFALYKVCVDTDGAVYSVKTLKGANPAVDGDWLALVRTLRHKPYTINGGPVPYCYPLRLGVRVTR
jgi:hypothetical protein